MSNGNTARIRRKQGFGLLSEEKHRELSSKGGKKRGLKGLAYIKKYDPERFQEIINKGGNATRAKYTISRNATEQSKNNGNEVQEES